MPTRKVASPRNARIGRVCSSSTGPLTLWLPANSRTHAQVSSGRRELAGVAKAMMPEAVLPRRPPARDLGVRARVGGEPQRERASAAAARVPDARVPRSSVVT